MFYEETLPRSCSFLLLCNFVGGVRHLRLPRSSAPRSPCSLLKPCHVEGVKQELRCGIYEVFENRQTRKGRKLPLKIVVIPAPSASRSRSRLLHGRWTGETATELTGSGSDLGRC